ncbi:MOSC domain-containing protein [Streptomyces albipurpureus]|uniref:MOSC domain-containing protein n=1 Tax=Streptomyces albipurpureus TaxID=2897419 RepID=A0ABT0UZS1_9ACTN|nr:MOSC N-terminal beta barrel domain-containing protein [Streptomyces sp. CWNU-1]MCM2394077.1 MOSC domain-containing protein [Streptomyces sp. CWNU-1]
MHVIELTRYPVKSLIGETASSFNVGRTGIVGDRAYALQDVETGVIVAAKNPRKWARLLTMTARYLEEPSLHDDTMPPVEITLPDGSTVRSDRDVDQTLSTFLGRQVRLLDQMPDDARYEFIRTTYARTDDGTFLEREAEAAEDIDMAKHRRLNFVDFSPMHVLSTASLRGLAQLRGNEGGIEPHRYRSNVLVEIEGAELAEQDWVGSDVTMGDVTVSVDLPTPRCIMTTLQHGPLPLDRGQLRAINRHNTLDVPPYGRLGCLGIYVTPRDEGAVSLGDPVSVVHRSEAVADRDGVGRG